MAHASLIVIGSSAGGIEALLTLVNGLPRHFGAALCIAQHLPASLPSHLDAFLSHLDTLPASFPADGARLRAGAIFLAPPAHDLTVIGEQVAVTPARRERLCPSVDQLFASAASSYGSRVIGVILSGLLTDGTRGLQAVKQAGGTTIIQDPREVSLRSL